jgi:rhomboid family GlyGly-CTERM serine protease
VSAGLQLLGQEQNLRFDRAAIDQGAVWLILSANLVHLGWNHMASNLAGLVLIFLLFQHTHSSGQWWLVLVSSSLAVGGGLYLLNPELHWYVGMSGTLHGLFVAGCLLEWRFSRPGAVLLSLAVWAKLGWEQWQGALPGTEQFVGGPVVVDSHLYGAVAGAGCGLALAAWIGRRPGEMAARSGEKRDS